MATFVGFWSRFVEDLTTRKQFYRVFASMMIDSTFLATFLDQKSTLVLESSLHSSFLQSPATASWCRSFTKNCRFDTAVSARFRFRNFGWYRYSKYKIQNTKKYFFSKYESVASIYIDQYQILTQMRVTLTFLKRVLYPVNHFFLFTFQFHESFKKKFL